VTESKPDIWFPAKRHGWGWGFPVAWQGWMVLLAYCVFLFGGAFILNPQYALFEYLIYTLFISCILLLICWRKGEKLRWRWGE
jgi:hypothetical protein